jgi:pyruvate dehydrogenase E2 component (dihydrolipoamide acetyltransferase)
MIEFEIFWSFDTMLALSGVLVMHIIRLPEKITGVGEATIGRWLKDQGEQVAKGDLILEVETSQALVEIESAIAGRLLRTLVHTGTVVPTGTPLCIVGEPDEDITAALDGLKIQTPPQQQAEAPGPAEQEGVETPPTTGAVGADAGKVVAIVMPQAGQTMEEGTVISWKVKQGDRIEVGQVIMEIETDKATMDFEAVDAGRLARIVVDEGETVAVKTAVAYLAENDADVDAYLAGRTAVAEPAPTARPAQERPAAGEQVKPTAPVVSSDGRPKASPAAKRLARERGVDLATIGSGSGPGGRIISGDVEAAAAAPQDLARRTMGKMRKAIAKNLQYSKQNIPHFYAKITVDTEAFFARYVQAKKHFKCTINDFVVMACAKAVRQYPGFRSRLEDDAIVELPSVNIGIAVGTKDGLVVPVVTDADQMSLELLAAKTREIVEAARGGKIAGLGKGVFTVTNLGMFDVEEFSAIINPPESAIVAVGAIREGAKVVAGTVCPARLMTINLSVDHRIIDGVTAAQFLSTLRELLEDPDQLL